jgi:molybdate/tungstate transport system permease protein
MTNTHSASENRTQYSPFKTLFIILSAFVVVYIIYPLANILTLIEPSKLLESLLRPQITNAFILSLATATSSTLLLAFFGIPLAYLIARWDFPGKFLLRLIIIIPLVLPPLASGILLLGVFGPYSPLGLAFPVEFTQSILGIIIAQTYVAAPFMILSAQTAFESVDVSYETVARTLGKSSFETFLQVSLPLAKTGLLVGFILSWVRAIGELGATMMLAYNPHTISIQIFEDNAIGGLQQAVPGILPLILLSIIILAVVSAVKKGEWVRLRW